MHKFQIRYLNVYGVEVVHLVRAEDSDTAKNYFTANTPFIPLSVTDLGEDVDSGKPPVIGPP